MCFFIVAVELLIKYIYFSHKSQMPASTSRWLMGWKAFTRWPHFLMEGQLLATVLVACRKQDKLRRISSENQSLRVKIEEELGKLVEYFPLAAPSRTSINRHASEIEEEARRIHMIGELVPPSTVRLLEDAALYACAAYELSAGMVSPVFANHVNSETQPILHRLLMEDAPSHHLVDFQYSKTPNTASFFILSRTARREIVLSFRGTQEIGDFLTDLMCSNGDGVNAVFHNGALESIQRDYDRIEMTLVHLAEAFPDFSIIIAGHSLGGGLAVTFAMHFFTAMKDKLPSLVDRAQVVTFGAMASLTAKGLEQYAEFSWKVLNVVSPRDPVPHMVTPVLTRLAENTSSPPPPPPMLQNPTMFLSAAVAGFVKGGEQKAQENATEEDATDLTREHTKDLRSDSQKTSGSAQGGKEQTGEDVDEEEEVIDEDRVLALAFFESPREEFGNTQHRQIVTNAIAMFPSHHVVRNTSIPILYQFGRFFVVLRRFSLCYAAEVSRFREVILAHLALSGYADLMDAPESQDKKKKAKNKNDKGNPNQESAQKPGETVEDGRDDGDIKKNGEEEVSSPAEHPKEDGSFRSFVDGFSESWRKYQKTAEHNMVIIPERLKRNLDFHSIVKYQESLAMLDCHETALEEAEAVLLRRASSRKSI